jgi:hypothetical protein
VCRADLLAPAPILSIVTAFRESIAAAFFGALLSDNPAAEAVRGAPVGEATEDEREAGALVGEAAVRNGSPHLICMVWMRGGTDAFFTGDGGTEAFFTCDGGMGAFFVGEGGIEACLIGEVGILLVIAEGAARLPGLLTVEVGVGLLTRRDGGSFDVGEEFPPFFVCLR